MKTILKLIAILSLTTSYMSYAQGARDISHCPVVTQKSIVPDSNVYIEGSHITNLDYCFENLKEAFQIYISETSITRIPKGLEVLTDVTNIIFQYNKLEKVVEGDFNFLDKEQYRLSTLYIVGEKNLLEVGANAFSGIKARGDLSIEFRGIVNHDQFHKQAFMGTNGELWMLTVALEKGPTKVRSVDTVTYEIKENLEDAFPGSDLKMIYAPHTLYGTLF